MHLSEPLGENGARNAKSIATVPTPASLLTSIGQLENTTVPRDREGQFHTQAFERSSRYEPHIARSG